MTSNISDARLAANRANALKSTGPKSPTGKSTSAMNGLVHGLRASTVILPGENADAFEASRAGLIDEFQPQTQTEQRLIDTMAASQWAVDRARRQEVAVLTRKWEEAAEQFDYDQAEKQRPERGLFAPPLTDSPERRAPLIARWKNIRSEIADFHWSGKSIDEAFRMLGLRPTGLVDGDALVEELTLAWTSLYFTCGDLPNRHRIGDAIYRVSNMRDIELEKEISRLMPKVPTAEAGQARLFKMIDEQIALLENAVDPSPDDPAADPEYVAAREAACALALFDASPEGTLRLRYMTAQENTFSRALRNLLALRKVRMKECVAPPPLPSPAPTEAKPIDPPKAARPTEPTAEELALLAKWQGWTDEPSVGSQERPSNPPYPHYRT